MKRKIIEIDREKCIGCGLCTKACDQGAIELVDGKAKLMSESYCDGLGMCLPECPVDAIHMVEREVDAFDPKRKSFARKQSIGSGCQSSKPKAFKKVFNSAPALGKTQSSTESTLKQWPVQLQLINPSAPYLERADLLIAADCTAFSFGDFHNRFMKDKITIIACPKLDQTDPYIEKLTTIFSERTVSSITVVRMSVPCCGGLPRIVKEALLRSGKIIPYSEVTLSETGSVLRTLPPSAV